jgi:hypothetical protein
VILTDHAIATCSDGQGERFMKHLCAAVLLISMTAACIADGGGSTGPTTPGAGSSLSVGQRVIAQYKGGKFWFVGRVASIEGGQIGIAYLDGDSAAVPASAVMPFDWGVGTAISCNWKRSNKWYTGKITAIDGDNIHMSYDDGDQEDTSIAYCRTER